LAALDINRSLIEFDRKLQLEAVCPSRWPPGIMTSSKGFRDMRRVLAPLAALGLLTTALILAPTAADAADGNCAGSLVVHKNLVYNDTKIGELDVYYNASTGVNCAKMNHGGPTAGVARDTYAYIAKCQATSPTGTCVVLDDDVDRGNFSSYAGPVKVTAGTHCITANGWIVWNGARRKVATGATVACQ
jgi:hypothetical protein